MSGTRRTIGDDGLSHVIGHWLDEGPTAAPDALVEKALGLVATTRQLRPRPRLLRMVPTGGPGLAIGLAGAALAAGIIVAVGLGLTDNRPPGVVPTPSSEASDGDASWTGELVIYRNETDGYELGIPPGWDAWEAPGTGFTYFSNPSLSDTGPRFLRVSVGTESGDIAIDCANCFVKARTMDELEAAIVARAPTWPDGAGGFAAGRFVSTTLDGHAARLRDPAGPGTGGITEGTCQMYTVWNDRPVVLALDCEDFRGGRSVNLGLFEDIVASFRFLEPGQTSAGLSLYRNDLDGYQLLVPDAWAARTYDAIPDGVRMFGSGLDQIYPALTVSIGRPDGGVQICRTAGCELVKATTLDQLDEVLRAGPPELGRPERSADTVLGGVPARVDWISSGGTIWAPLPAFRYEYTIHEGRPVVLAFDHWLTHCVDCGGQFRLTSSVLEEIIGSFEFLDGFGEPPPTVGEELVFPEAGVAFALVGALRDVVAIDRSTIEISGGRQEAVVLIGNDDGQVRTCTRSAGPWEECRVITADSIEDLVSAIRPRSGEADDHGVRVPGNVATAAIQLGGEEATSITIEDYEYPARGGETIRYVLAMDDGRPIVLRLYSPVSEPMWMADFLATFRFLD